MVSYQFRLTEPSRRLTIERYSQNHALRTIDFNRAQPNGVKFTRIEYRMVNGIASKWREVSEYDLRRYPIDDIWEEDLRTEGARFIVAYILAALIGGALFIGWLVR